MNPLRQDITLLSEQIASKEGYLPALDYRICQTLERIAQHQLKEFSPDDIRQCQTLYHKAIKVVSLEEPSLGSFFQSVLAGGGLFRKASLENFRKAIYSQEALSSVFEDVESFFAEDGIQVFLDAINGLDEQESVELVEKLKSAFFSVFPRCKISDVKKIQESLPKVYKDSISIEFRRKYLRTPYGEDVSTAERLAVFTYLSISEDFTLHDLAAFAGQMMGGGLLDPFVAVNDERSCALFVFSSCLEKLKAFTSDWRIYQKEFEQVDLALRPFFTHLYYKDKSDASLLLNLYMEAIPLEIVADFSKEFPTEQKEDFILKAIECVGSDPKYQSSDLYQSLWDLIHTLPFKNARALESAYLTSMPPLILAKFYESIPFFHDEKKFIENGIEGLAVSSRYADSNFHTRVWDKIQALDNPSDKAHFFDLYIDRVPLHLISQIDPREFGEVSPEAACRLIERTFSCFKDSSSVLPASLGKLVLVLLDSIEENLDYLAKYNQFISKYIEIAPTLLVAVWDFSKMALSAPHSEKLVRSCIECIKEKPERFKELPSLWHLKVLRFLGSNRLELKKEYVDCLSNELLLQLPSYELRTSLFFDRHEVLVKEGIDILKKQRQEFILLEKASLVLTVWDLIKDLEDPLKIELIEKFMREVPLYLLVTLPIDEVKKFYLPTQQENCIGRVLSFLRGCNLDHVPNRVFSQVASFITGIEGPNKMVFLEDYLEIAPFQAIVGCRLENLLLLADSSKGKFLRKIVEGNWGKWLDINPQDISDLIGSIKDGSLRGDLKALYNFKVPEEALETFFTTKIFSAFSTKRKVDYVKNVVEIIKSREQLSIRPLVLKVLEVLGSIEEPSKSELIQVLDEELGPTFLVSVFLEKFSQDTPIDLLRNLIDVLKGRDSGDACLDAFVSIFDKISLFNYYTVEVNAFYREFIASTAEGNLPGVLLRIIKEKGLIPLGIVSRMTSKAKEMFFQLLGVNLTMNLFQATESKESRMYALKIARSIFEVQNELGLEEKNPLIDSAVYTISFLEVDKSDKYYVYALIKQMKKAYADVAPTIEPTTAFLEGGESVSLELNYEGLHTGIQRLESKTKTYQEFTSWIEEINKSLPPGSPPLAPDIFQKLLTDFWTHIKKESQTDPGNERLKKLLGEITEIYNNFTSSDRLVTQLMEAPFKQPDEIVDRETERLYAIGAALLQKKSKPSPGELLSEREELIIAWLPLIEECSVGQARGIAVCYNQFKVEGAIPGLLNEVGSHLEIDNSLDYLDDVVQKTMEEILPEVLEELGITKVEGVHQALALKNILAKEAGLNHSMTIDPYGGWVDQNLLFQKREDVLRIFFSILTKALVISLKKDTTEAVNTSASKLYDNLMVFFEASGIDPSLAWQEIEGGFLVHFKEGQKEPITLLTAIESLREFPLEESFWEIKGSEIFLKEDGARFFGGILPSGALKEEQAAEFLRLVQIHAVNQRKEIIKSNLKEELKHALVQEEKENGSILLTKQAQAQFKALYRDKDPSLGLSLAEFSEFLTGRLSELVKKPAKLDLFISQEISKWQSSFRWSLKEAPSSYKLTDYGAIAFLEKGGYLEVKGKYKEYIDLEKRIAQEQKKLDAFKAQPLVDEQEKTRLKAKLDLLRPGYVKELRLKKLEVGNFDIEKIQDFEAQNALYDTLVRESQEVEASTQARAAQALLIEQLRTQKGLLQEELRRHSEIEQIPRPKRVLAECLVQGPWPLDIKLLRDDWKKLQNTFQIESSLKDQRDLSKLREQVTEAKKAFINACRELGLEERWMQ